MAKPTIADRLRGYGVSNPKDIALLEVQLDSNQVARIMAAKTRGHIQNVLAQVAVKQGMKSDNPKKFVHP